MKDYRPTLTAIPGTNAMAADYGAAHAARQADAEAALAGIDYAGTAVLLTVRCRNRHRLAVVYRTPDGPMVLVYRAGHDGLEIKDLRERHAIEMHFATDTMADPVDAPDDRELEARCRCGGVEIDRYDLRDRLADGVVDWVLT